MKIVLAGLVACAACASTGRGAAVATPEPYAAQAAQEILADGGNAADAAACIGFVLAVTHPQAGNLGGGGFLVVHTPGEDFVIDARETAPAAADRDMYLGADGEPVRSASLVGPLAAGVPGSVDGYLLLHEKLGKLPRGRVLEPAIRLATDGFVVDSGLAASFASARPLLERFAETRRVFLRGGRDVPQAGERLRQPALARVLRAIATRGRAGFYSGSFALGVEHACERHGGRITRADMQAYRAKIRTPLRGTYRGYDVLTMPPPSSGGVVLLSMLDFLERGDFAASDATARAHLFVEAGRRTFADRAAYFGDPDFVDVPVGPLLEADYLARRFATFDAARATPSGEVAGGLAAAVGAAEVAAESEETCHFSVVDGAGIAIACTTTLNGSFGCGLAVHGVLLNNEMDDFTVKPGAPNQFGLVQSALNAVEPGKRPLSSMTPTIVLRDGKPVLVVGSPGGPTIISTVCQVIANRYALGMDLPEAVAAPRLHHQWLPDVVLHERLPEGVADGLAALGHACEARTRALGDVQAVGLDADGNWIGVPDPRGRGAGWPAGRPTPSVSSGK